jgi:ABC-2 type transport system ATP-binding protein
MHIIETEGLTKHYEGVTALRDVTFGVEEGDVFALVGPNGAGKTTLLRLLTGILSPDAGEARLFGDPEVRHKMDFVGYMPEERGLYKAATALETVAYFASLKGVPAREAKSAARDALQRVGMLAHAGRKLEELSKGMSQRVQFAATIAHRPRLLILDEPFSGLDPVSSLTLRELIENLRTQGCTILLSTHSMETAERMCSRLLMLYRGTVRLYGDIAELKQQYSSNRLRVEFGLRVPQLPEGSEAMPDGSIAVACGDSAPGRLLLHWLEDGIEVVRFEPLVPTLEEIFLQVAGEDAHRDLRSSASQADAA